MIRSQLSILLIGISFLTLARNASVASAQTQATEEICTTCRVVDNVSQKYCGDFKPVERVWADGDWIECPADYVEPAVRNVCSECYLYPGPGSGAVRCALYNFETKRWASKGKIYACNYRPSTGGPSLPRIGGGTYRPGASDQNYDPVRSAFNPDGSRNLARERANRLKYGTPYDRNNRREARYWRTLYER
jgi:hypothetical protein